MSDEEPRSHDLEGAASEGGSGVAVVLAGAGARGAYEAGSLSVLLPALGASQPRLYLGTSAGAINAVGFSALSHLDPETAGKKALDMWRSVRERDVFRPPLISVVEAVAERVARCGAVRPRPVGLLNTAPLHRTLGRRVNWDQLRVNIRHGQIDGCGVVATKKSCHAATVFLEGMPWARIPEPDPVRGIRYVRSTLTPAHVVASSSLPAVFPAVAIDDPGGGRDYYVDGGVRLNTPIKPALTLAADRVVVVATSSVAMPPVAGDALGRPPGIGSGLLDILRAVLDDRVAEDIRSLVRENEKAASGTCGAESNGGPRRVDYVFGGPQRAGQLGELAREVLSSRRIWHPRASVDRLVAGSPDLCELASYVLFDPDFIDGAIELGRQDARAQLRRGAVAWRSTDLPVPS